MSKKVLIVCSVIPAFVDGLLEAGFEVDEHPEMDRATMIESISGYEGLIIRSKQLVNEELIVKADKLKFVGRVGSGLENVDLQLLNEKGIRLYRSPEGNADAVAEHALGMLLALLNKLRAADKMVRKMDWNREAVRGVRLAGKTIGLVGYGHTGRAFASKLKSMGVRILVNDPYVEAIDDHCQKAGLDEMLQEIDILSYHVPLTSETHHHFNLGLIEKIKKSFYLINTSRGSVVNTSDLLAGLASGKVLGAALDVFENEEMDKICEKDRNLMQRLCEFEDVILSPHVAGWNDYSKSALHDILLKKIVGREG